MLEIKGYYVSEYNCNITKNKIPTPDELNKVTSELLKGSKAMREKFNIKEDNNMARPPKYTKEELEYASKDLDIAIGTVYGLLADKKLKDLSKESIREYKESKNTKQNKKIYETNPDFKDGIKEPDVLSQEEISEMLEIVKDHPKEISEKDVKRFEKEINQSHYQQGNIQPIDYILANNMDFLEGNIIKYVSRYKYKNGLDDLLKAKDYLERLIKEVQK